MAVRCGRCAGSTYHDSVAEVRRCFNGETVDAVQQEASEFNNQADDSGSTAPRPTEKQLRYTESLLAARSLTYGPGLDTLDKRSISDVIRDLTSGDWRLLEPGIYIKDATAEDLKADFDPDSLESGIYLYKNEIYKVQIAVHGSGHNYAKRLRLDSTPDSDAGMGEPVGYFVHAPGMVRKLRPEHKMSLEQAKEFGALYGICCQCGRTLTDETSIANGIGPVCGAKF